MRSKKGNSPPTVAPMSATNRNRGMLKTELTGSLVSARASKGIVRNMALAKRTAIAGNLKM